jgi:hypothetical protein
VGPKTPPSSHEGRTDRRMCRGPAQKILKTFALDATSAGRRAMVTPREKRARICRRLRPIDEGETHVFGAMDLGAKIAVVVTIIVVVGLAITAIRWFKAQNR